MSDERTRCWLCGEPVELAYADDPESWVHAEDANDWADHSAEVLDKSKGFAWASGLKNDGRRSDCQPLAPKPIRASTAGSPGGD